MTFGITNRRVLVICAVFLSWVLGFANFINLTEVGGSQSKIVILTTIGLYCVALVVTRQPLQSAVITMLITFAIWAVSKAKMAYLGSPFVFGDLVNMMGYNLFWVLSQYSGLAVAGAAAAVAFLVLMIWLVRRPGRRVSLITACAAGALAFVLAGPISHLSRVVYFWDQDFDETAAGISTFTASVVWWWGSGGNAVTLYDVADQSLGGPAASPEREVLRPKPNIFMVLNESVFDPRVLGLPIQEEVADYFQPSEGLSGLLSVNVHGGGTWVSEFAVMSGIDTRVFGDKAFYLPALMEKRVHHSLVHALNDQGYRTVVVYCVNGSFMNAENFYRSLGVREFHVPAQMATKGKVKKFRDSELYERALELMSSGAESDDPVFMLVVTISNHGPHAQERVSETAFPEVRDWLANNLQGPGFEEYKEYYLRLMQGIEDYEKLKSDLTSRFKDRPTLLVRFGDHHPKFTKYLDFPGRVVRKSALLTTYFAVEAINGELAAWPDWGSGPLDIAYLSTLVLDTAGLPMDQVFETRRQLMTSCAGRYFACQDARRARLHRTLLDRGYLEVDRVELAEAESGPDVHR